jgi:GMP synthase (glutamine-hydrolysing)
MSSHIHTDKILILDFGSQYTQLIARRIREIGVYCEIHSFRMAPELIKAFEPKGIILSGGPETVTALETPRAPDIVFELGCPVFGICYGMQTMALQLGGQVEIAEHHEFGHIPLIHEGTSPLFDILKDEESDDGKFVLNVWMSHGDRVITLPPNFICIASTNNTPIAAMQCKTAPFYAIQCHPEVTHTAQGKEIFKQFVINICQCKTMWNAEKIIEDLEENIRIKIGKERVLLALSGGTDSSVLAALLQRAIGSQCVCIFVDTGLLRHKEADNLIIHLREHLNVTIHVVDAKGIFLQRLQGIEDPEQKRKIIGTTFIEIFEQEALKLDDIRWLAQGTIYPDVIESAGAGASTGQTHVIKSHHNVGGLPETMKLNLLEPLRELFKDEVRQIGTQLGLPSAFVNRHPFPGPGLAVRILGEIKEDYIRMVRQADIIFLEELQKADYYDKVNQAFAVFLPVKSVGVKGDARKYDYVIALRAVETIDFMTAQWAPLPHDLLAKAANRIMNEVEGVSRVVYDISSKPPATIEWE